MNNLERNLFDMTNAMIFLFSIRCNGIKKALLFFAVLVILSLFGFTVQRKFSTTVAALQTVHNLTYSAWQDNIIGPTKREHIDFS